MACLVPERMDDLAWENDKVAHRIYGPAVRASLESSGIDVGAAIHWTAPKVAEFSNVFEYPITLDGNKVYEHRYSRLALGERLTEIHSFFSHDQGQSAKPILNFPYEVAIELGHSKRGRRHPHVRRRSGQHGVHRTHRRQAPWSRCAHRPGPRAAHGHRACLRKIPKERERAAAHPSGRRRLRALPGGLCLVKRRRHHHA